jgi:hypothetical protein
MRAKLTLDDLHIQSLTLALGSAYCRGSVSHSALEPTPIIDTLLALEALIRWRMR